MELANYQDPVRGRHILGANGGGEWLLIQGSPKSILVRRTSIPLTINDVRGSAAALRKNPLRQAVSPGEAIKPAYCRWMWFRLLCTAKGGPSTSSGIAMQVPFGKEMGLRRWDMASR